MTIVNNNFESQLINIRGLSAEAFQNNKKIQDCKIGSFLELNSLTYKIDKLNKYLDVKWSSFARRKKEYWVYELTLSCLENASTKFIEWEVDDELEVFETIEELKIRDVRYNDGTLTKSMLEYISDEEEGTVVYKGVKYYYSDDDTWAALFFDCDVDDDGGQVRFYEFESDDGVSLTIESWVDEEKTEREAFLSKKVTLSKINILNI
jgi:hypothetical protein